MAFIRKLLSNAGYSCGAFDRENDGLDSSASASPQGQGLSALS